MATKTVKDEKTADVPAGKNSARVKTSSVSRYTVDELSKAENEFNTNKVIIRTALSMSDKDLFTLEEAKEIVSKFKNKEVKEAWDMFMKTARSTLVPVFTDVQATAM